MNRHITDIDIIEASLSLLPSGDRKKISDMVAAVTQDAQKSGEAQQLATRKAAGRWMDTVYNAMLDDDWDEYRKQGYDLDFLNALKEVATRYSSLATQAQEGYLSEWENIIYVYAFNMGREAAQNGD